jgi:hypothetical protein
MKEIVKNFESKVTGLESEVTELKAKDVQMRDKVAQQDSLLSDLLREKNERTASAAANFESAPMRSNESAVAINGLPSSCEDLKMIGHLWSGFYSIAGSTMMESVYCDFSKLPSDPSNCFILILISSLLKKLFII